MVCMGHMRLVCALEQCESCTYIFTSLSCTTGRMEFHEIQQKTNPERFTCFDMRHSGCVTHLKSKHVSLSNSTAESLHSNRCRLWPWPMTNAATRSQVSWYQPKTYINVKLWSPICLSRHIKHNHNITTIMNTHSKIFSKSQLHDAFKINWPSKDLNSFEP